jgi:NADH:ubiquinone oxidoreductase subunit C
MSDVAMNDPARVACRSHARRSRRQDRCERKIAYGELTLTVHRNTIVEVAQYALKADGFVSIIDVCGVDYPDREERFDVVYHLLNPKRNQPHPVKVATDEEDTPVPSITGVFPGAGLVRARGLRSLRHPVLRPS